MDPGLGQLQLSAVCLPWQYAGGKVICRMVGTFGDLGPWSTSTQCSILALYGKVISDLVGNLVTFDPGQLQLSAVCLP